MLVQVAGVLDGAEASMLLEAGVDLLGFPLGPGIRTRELTFEQAVAILREVGCADRSVLITYLDSAPAIVAYAAALGVDRVQLHAPIAREEVEALRRSSALQLSKSVIVTGSGSAVTAALAAEMDSFAPLVDSFIVDSYDAVTGARGATGRTHDWSVTRRLVERSSKPVLLAGGLTAENVRDAVRAVRPAGVDVHTGIEAPDGRKSPEKTRAFVQAARDATEGLA
jgi:phosphoribosylanthranilate isomerase